MWGGICKENTQCLWRSGETKIGCGGNCFFFSYEQVNG